MEEFHRKVYFRKEKCRKQEKKIFQHSKGKYCFVNSVFFIIISRRKEFNIFTETNWFLLEDKAMLCVFILYNCVTT